MYLVHFNCLLTRSKWKCCGKSQQTGAKTRPLHAKHILSMPSEQALYSTATVGLVFIWRSYCRHTSPASSMDTDTRWKRRKMVDLWTSRHCDTDNCIGGGIRLKQSTTRKPNTMKIDPKSSHCLHSTIRPSSFLEKKRADVQGAFRHSVPTQTTFHDVRLCVHASSSSLLSSSTNFDTSLELYSFTRLSTTSSPNASLVVKV